MLPVPFIYLFARKVLVWGSDKKYIGKFFSFCLEKGEKGGKKLEEKAKKGGLVGMECYYSRYTKAESDFLLAVAKKHDLLISGGSDYHGTNKTVKLGELSADGIAIPTENLTVLSLL